MTRLRAFQRQTEDSHAWVVIGVVYIECASEVLTGEGTETSELLVSDDNEGARLEKSE